MTLRVDRLLWPQLARTSSVNKVRKIRHYLSKTKARIPLTWRRHQGLRPEDVFLASYPRSGNTWLRFLLFELLTGEAATFEAINGPASPVPEIRNYRQSPALLPGNGRLIKTHEPYRNEYKKAIYLVRDARDVATSQYNFLRRHGIDFTSFDEFLRLFVLGKVSGYGAWQKHVHSWLEAEQTGMGKILIIQYESLRCSEKDAMTRILDFLGVDVDNSRLQAAIQNNSIEAMREKEAMARKTVFRDYREDIDFVGQGSVGGWRQLLTEAQVQLVEAYNREALARLGYLSESECREISYLGRTRDENPEAGY